MDAVQTSAYILDANFDSRNEVEPVEPLSQGIEHLGPLTQSNASKLPLIQCFTAVKTHRVMTVRKLPVTTGPELHNLLQSGMLQPHDHCHSVTSRIFLS